MSMTSWTASGGEALVSNQSDWNCEKEPELATNDSAWKAILSSDDLVEKNDSVFNVTGFGEEAEVEYVMDAIGYFLVALALLLVIACWVCNVVVLVALKQLGDDKMKVKFLLKNAILGDILVSISVAVRAIFAATGILQNSQAGIAIRCVSIAYTVFGYIAAFYQIFTSMAVACDRFYSMLNPLKYHSMRYSKCAKVTICAIIVVAVLSLSLPAALVKLKPGKPFIIICQDAYKYTFYSTAVLPFVILACVFFILVIYCGVLCLIAYHRRVHRETLGEKNESQNVRRRQVSLAITFFLIHITYVIMYIPGNIYYAFRPPGLTPNLNYYFNQIVLIIYLGNTVIDPLIYIFRIQSIRERVRLMFSPVPSTQKSKSKSRSN